MSKGVKIGLILAALGVVLIAVLVVVVRPMLPGAPRGVVGPDIAALDHTWGTRIIEGDDGHNQMAVWAVMEAPDSFDVTAVSKVPKLFSDLCNGILDNLDAFTPDGFDPNNLDHVDMNLVAGRQTALAHDIMVVVKNGACTERYSASIITDDKARFSRHNAMDEFSAILNSWGVKQSGITFANVNGKKHIEVRYELLSEYERVPDTVSVQYLCVLALMGMKKQVNLVVLKVDPVNYTEIHLRLQKSKGFGGASYARNYGTQVVSLKDGQCGEVVTI